MGAFDKYWQEKADWDNSHPEESVKKLPQDSIMFNQSVFFQTIDDIDQMDDVTLRKFIQNNFRVILDNVFFGNQPQRYLKCFTDARFLQAFIDVISVMEFFENEDSIKCNTICYHYITLPDDKKDPRIVELMMRMSSIINRPQLPRLLGLGLSENLASTLLIARHSDLDVNICIKRIDFIIITQPKVLMTEKMISEIFKCLYDVFSDWPRVFPCIMQDVLPEYNESNPYTLWVTEDIQEVDSTLSLAALGILNDLPSDTIRTTLINYAEGHKLVNPNTPVRFSMNRLSDDYYRINNVVADLNYREGIKMP